MKAGGDSGTRAGETLAVGVPADASYLFDAEGHAMDRAPFG